MDELVSALGHENVCVLLMEDMSKADFWHEMADFLGVERTRLAAGAAGHAPTENRKGSGDHTWPLWPVRTHKRGAVTGGVVSYYWQTKRFPYALRLTRAAATQLSRSVWDLDAASRRFLESRGLELEIAMTPALREKIRTYCEPFTARLGEQLQRDDLEDLGY